MKRYSSRTGGSTLMLALWALIVLSAVVFAWVRVIDQGIDGLNNANRGMEARALAHSGLAVALHPNISRMSPHLKASFERNRSYRVIIESEGGRLNLNYLLAGGDPAKIAFLKNYLALHGLTFQEREVFVEWVSPAGGVHRLNGVPESADYRPAHRALQSLDEIALIAGSAPLIANAGWKDDLTLYSTGPLDIESASAELLSLVPGIGEARAQRFIKIREERLHAAENKEGYPFKNLAEALSYLELSQEQFAALAGFLGFRDPVQHIQSVGESAKVMIQVDAIVRKVSGANAKIILWSEK